jgi:hypothetical protein
MSPSQASETCASASSATSARGEIHYANALKECQETASYLSTRQSIVSRGINDDDAKRGFADPDSSFDNVGSGHRQNLDYGGCEYEWDCPQ